VHTAQPTGEVLQYSSNTDGKRIFRKVCLFDVTTQHIVCQHPRSGNLKLEKHWVHEIYFIHLPDVEKSAELNCDIILQIRLQMVEISPENSVQWRMQSHEKH